MVNGVFFFFGRVDDETSLGCLFFSVSVCIVDSALELPQMDGRTDDIPAAAAMSFAPFPCFYLDFLCLGMRSGQIFFGGGTVGMEWVWGLGLLLLGWVVGS